MGTDRAAAAVRAGGRLGKTKRCRRGPTFWPGRSVMEMSVGVLDHYNVSTRKLKETVQFYEDVLGFMNGPRPELNFPGAWLYSDAHAVLHLNDISQTDLHQRPD